MRRVPLLRSDIARTTGARMYAMSPANTNGSRTFRPRIRMRTMKSGKPQRRRNVRPEPSGPKNVAVRLRVGPLGATGNGPVTVPLDGPLSGGGIVSRGTPPLPPPEGGVPPAGSLGGGSGGDIG